MFQLAQHLRINFREISRRLGLALVLACLCLPNVIGSGNPANGLYPQSKPAPEIGSDSHRLDGFYFGASENQLGKRGWLLSLDSEARRGRLYMPPGNLELTGLEVNNAGQVTFHSNRDVGDLIYRFEGQVGSNGVLGQFIITRAFQISSSETSHVPVTLRRVDLSKADKSPVDLSGVYSSVRYNLDSGDLTGEELVLFGQGQEFPGIFTAFEGDMLPYVLVDFARSGNRIRFRIITRFGEENYAGSVVRRGLRLRRLNAKDDHNAPDMVLFKRKDVTNIFPPLSRVWHAATYRGLKMGRSKVAEMRRVLGRPSRSEVFGENKSNREVWYHYEGMSEFPGRVTVVVEKNTGTIQAIDIIPKSLRKEDAIKHFGPEYIITRYDFDLCLGDHEAAPLFESPAGSVISIEYRQQGIAVAVDEAGRVDTISYISKALGAETSKCK